MTVISMADFKRRESNLAKQRQGQWCGPCWDKHKEVHLLQRHKLWGGDVGLHCPNCWEEFDAD